MTKQYFFSGKTPVVNGVNNDFSGIYNNLKDRSHRDVYDDILAIYADANCICTHEIVLTAFTPLPSED